MIILNLRLASIKSAGSLLHRKFKCTRQEVLTQAASDAHIHAPSGTWTRREGLCAQVLLSCCDRDCYLQLPGATERAQSRVSKHVGSVAQAGNNKSCLQESQGQRMNPPQITAQFWNLWTTSRARTLKMQESWRNLNCRFITVISLDLMSHPTLSFCMCWKCLTLTCK